ncbi:hypothetical protein RJ639_001669 [Escallonia herrerae]|uniref:Magnesium transporter n=1 Tax=Escallonia herrerae TaxID=1293975 RepID=A0AA89BNX1_9ASTE|nr:hypothetical protein RJ639_001669 [Escallonia herrerae]
MASISSCLLQLPICPPSPSSHCLLLPCSRISSRINPVPAKLLRRVECLTRPTEESDSDTLMSDGSDGNEESTEDLQVAKHRNSDAGADRREFSPGSQRVANSLSDSLGIREPVYEVRDNAILLNLGPLRAIAMEECVFIFNYNRKGGKAFIDALLPRLNPEISNGGPSMPFELEVVEEALNSRIQRLEQRLMELEPRVQALLEVLPNRLTADVLEQLRISKQTLVELGSKAGALKQMLLDILEDPHEIRRICIMGRNCTLKKENDDMECSVPLEKQIAEEEEEEIEMLLENYLQRCESCHGQAERLLDSAKEMEDSIAVNLSSRRLEVSRVELLLQVGTFCVAVGALVAGIFGMNLKSYLEEHVFAFWLTTAGIIVGAVVAFFLMYTYLKARKIF